MTNGSQKRKTRTAQKHAEKPAVAEVAQRTGVQTLKVEADEAGMRLDRWFRVHFPEVGYTYLQKLLRSGQVRIDSKRAQANDRLTAGSEIRVPAIIRQPKAKGTGLKPPP